MFYCYTLKTCKDEEDYKIGKCNMGYIFRDVQSLMEHVIKNKVEFFDVNSTVILPEEPSVIEIAKASPYIYMRSSDVSIFYNLQNAVDQFFKDYLSNPDLTPVLRLASPPENPGRKEHVHHYARRGAIPYP